MKGEQWDDTASNAQQRYLTHGAFRYFGKLPPTLTARILDEMKVGTDTTVVDLMAGSGTTLIEAGIRGANAIGVDCNDLSVLVARVKTSAAGLPAALSLQHDFLTEFRSTLSLEDAGAAASHLKGSIWAKRAAKSSSPKIQNFDRWFPPATAFTLKILREWTSCRTDSQRDIARLIFAAIVRPASMASAAAGRIFFDVDKRPPNPFALMRKPMSRLVEGLRSLGDQPGWDDERVKILLGDARDVNLGSGLADLVFAHPPYFALYRYSSDVLRFELDWLGIGRRDIARREIEDGFKTTDAGLADRHVADMLAILKTANSVAKVDGKLVIVTANSTLRKQPLPIIEAIDQGSRSVGWQLKRRIERRVRFAQSSYHRSADPEITRPSDEILIFERP